MADIPASTLVVTRTAAGTVVMQIFQGPLSGTTPGPGAMLIDQFALTTAQCTTIATRLAQGAIGGAGTAGTDNILCAATTSDQQAGGGSQVFNAS